MKSPSKDKRSISTRTGDGGTTYCGETVLKNHPRIEALGCLDELCSMLGVSRVIVGWNNLELCDGNKVYKLLLAIQTRLFAAGKILVAPIIIGDKISQKDIDELDRLVSLFEKEYDIPNGFIIPGGEGLKITQPASFIDVSRSICRRLERNIISVKCEMSEKMNDLDILIKWVNRLSDVLWLLARIIEDSSYLLYTDFSSKKLDYGF